MADDVALTEGQQVLFDKLCALIDAQNDGMILLVVAQDLVIELLRRDGDTPLREQTLGEISRFFLGIIKAPDLSDQYKMDRLKLFVRATLTILLDRRRQARGEGASAPPLGLARRATDHGPASP